MYPEGKILLYILFVVLVSVVSSLTAYALICCILCLFLLKIPFRSVTAGWIPISLFLLFTFLSNVVNQHGRIVFAAGPLVLTQEGFYLGALRTLRVLFMIAGAKILVALSSPEEIIAGLWRLLRPVERLGLPVKDFFSTMGLTLKCFPVLKKVLQENYRKQVSSSPVKGIWSRSRAVSQFLFPLFVETLQAPEKFFIEPETGEKKN